MANAVALNIDLGELPGEPEELYRLATVVNVACGGHAGDAASMARAIELATSSGARIAAHPSYPDRAGFGRRTIAISAPDLRGSIAEQCAELQRIAAGAVRTVKPHGALYHDAARDPEIAAAVMEGAALGLGTGDLTWVGPSRGAVYERAAAAGLAYEREAFADRGTLPDGSLVPRGQPGALIEDPARAASLALAYARSGAADTLCVHSDTQGAVAIARAVRAALIEAGMLGRKP
jgi:5-oxoprolinase (ATP-hydrolysing) subunit A